MHYLKTFIDFFLHLDVHLGLVISQYGTFTYVILFLIIFAETGLVITPFLPGDSLLFAVGAFASKGYLDIYFVYILLFIAAVIGDSINYNIGKIIGPKVFHEKNTKFFKKEYLDKTEKFYEKYGAKTIIIARFMPIIRTFAPFVAGIGKMNYREFFLFNVIGAFLWVTILLFAGYFFGQIDFVEKNFTYVIFAIIFISILPAVVEYLRSRR